MRTMLLLIAAVILVLCVSCPKHKSYGGSSSSGSVESESTRGSGLFGSGVPSGNGPHIDIGQGWDVGTSGKIRSGLVNPLDAAGFSWGWGCYSQEFEEAAVSATSATIHYAYRLSAIEKKEGAWGEEECYLLQLRSTEDGWECHIGDKVAAVKDWYAEGDSVYRVDFSLPEKGNYVLAVGSGHLLIRY